MNLKKLKYPRSHREPMWHSWLWKGFEELGYNRQEHTSPVLSSQILEFDCPMLIEIDKKAVCYDYADFVKIYRMDIKRDVTFKIQCLNAYKDIKPIAQISGKLEFDQERFKYIDQPKVYDVCGMFRTTNYHERLFWIEKVMEMRLKTKLSLYQTPDRPIVPTNIPQERPKYYDHWQIQSQSKINLAIPGIGYDEGSTWSFRHTEILGMGGFALLPETQCKYPGQTKGCWVHTKLTKLKDTIKYYLKNDKEREEIAKNGLDYYNKYIKPSSMASYMLENI